MICLYRSLIKYLIMGRVSDRRSTFTNPALRKVAAKPVKAKASGMLVFFGSTGYPSTIFALHSLAYFTAAFSNFTVTPLRLKGFATEKQTTDQTGSSSILCNIRDRSKTEYVSLGATEHHAMG